ncbi:putative mitochondrial hypothetical protein [Leptomonas pyrrhocoris]|uniref:Uncharacterized protein n=1 Tax=Leptomonas pyrrhocoris TaxID=157538 RepID=A0A0M9G196_LEPPY|nr:putative mitochondrial hypothetical protein [Leptomonas pyrrhocoris]XP_015658735.1 putative mitochondrial hypothetical protein [Leptomonas pyrrhocoris]KPA80295.1 putative mitochondrial hypothetical protein [Leptomonas pyrrhocoris]KPA80296.1 putative mitochondrial hypothetical protein [Leptomonas pyrrhocoris]|eukprot:XP_015658734.1 putative mitochondrial hypothetical protein [Leptomonas pyrrhocoris]
MPFWKDYIYAKPEVDDDDLPLPEHRIFDDDGYIKDKVERAVAAAWRTSPSRAANAKKSSPLSPKRRAELLKSVGAKPTTPVKVVEVKAQTPAAAAAAAAPAAPLSRASSRSRSSTTRKSAARSPVRSPKAASTPRSASSGHKPSPKKASPNKAAAKRTSAKQSTPSRSPARARARSPSPTKPKASPRAATRAKRSRSRSGSRKAARASRPKTPSPKWTVAALREFAKDKSIPLAGATKKADILHALKRSS